MSKAEKTRQFIVETAAPIINRKGMAGTSISDIMEATKLAKGCVYGNFESKEEICNEVFDHLTAKLSLAIDARLATKTTSKEKLFALLDYYIELHAKEGTYGCPLLNFGTEVDDTNPEMRQKVSKSINFSQNRIGKLVRSGIQSGEFRKTVDADAFAVRAFAMAQGAMWMSRVQNNTRSIRAIVNMLKQEIEDFTR
jgi:AcrR family transcriptional regulator